MAGAGQVGARRIGGAIWVFTTRYGRSSPGGGSTPVGGGAGLAVALVTVLGLVISKSPAGPRPVRPVHEQISAAPAMPWPGSTPAFRLRWTARACALPRKTAPPVRGSSSTWAPYSAGMCPRAGHPPGLRRRRGDGAAAPLGCLPAGPPASQGLFVRFRNPEERSIPTTRTGYLCPGH